MRFAGATAKVGESTKSVEQRTDREHRSGQFARSQSLGRTKTLDLTGDSEDAWRDTAVIAIHDPDDPRIEPYRAVRDRDLAGRGGLFVAEGEVGAAGAPLGAVALTRPSRC